MTPEEVQTWIETTGLSAWSEFAELAPHLAASKEAKHTFMCGFAKGCEFAAGLDLEASPSEGD